MEYNFELLEEARQTAKQYVKNKYRKEIDLLDRGKLGKHESQELDSRLHALIGSYAEKLHDIYITDPGFATLDPYTQIKEMISGDKMGGSVRSSKEIKNEIAENLRKQDFKAAGLYDTADGERFSWMDMSAEEFMDAGTKLGFNMHDPEMVKRFMQYVQDDTGTMVRSKIANDASSGITNTVGQLAFPSLWEEGLKQISSGEYNDSNLKKNLAVDLATNVAMATGTPFVASKIANPALGWAIPTAMDTGLEAGRQALKTGKFNGLNVGASFGAAATIPAGVAAVGGLSGKLNGSGKRFAEGVMGSVTGRKSTQQMAKDAYKKKVRTIHEDFKKANEANPEMVMGPGGLEIKDNNLMNMLTGAEGFPQTFKISGMGDPQYQKMFSTIKKLEGDIKRTDLSIAEKRKRLMKAKYQLSQLDKNAVGDLRSVWSNQGRVSNLENNIKRASEENNMRQFAIDRINTPGGDANISAVPERTTNLLQNENQNVIKDINFDSMAGDVGTGGSVKHTNFTSSMEGQTPEDYKEFAKTLGAVSDLATMSGNEKMQKTGKIIKDYLDNGKSLSDDEWKQVESALDEVLDNPDKYLSNTTIKVGQDASPEAVESATKRNELNATAGKLKGDPAFKKPDKWENKGISAGNHIQEWGLALEPTFKFNPAAIPGKVYDKLFGEESEPNYRSQDWYKGLNSRQRKLVDGMFEKKEED